MPYPSVISALANPAPTDRLNSPSHSGLHDDENAAIVEIQNFVGTLSSTAGTLIYDVRSSSSDGGGHIQSANKGGTGQTMYSKGDLLVGQSQSVLSRLTVGANDTVLIADSSAPVGVKWGAVPGVNVQSFVGVVGSTITGTWNKPGGATVSSRVFVELWGGGGSGAGADSSEEAGGGGGGMYISGWFSSSVLASSVLVGVGQGGSGVLNGSDGIAGGNTVFNTASSTLTAFGGGGGGNSGSGGGGGGAGGLFSAGTSATAATGGPAGAQGIASVFSTGGGDSNVAAQSALYAAGGGGDGAAGGSAIYGGAGGGGVRSSTFGAAGTSRFGGSGSPGSIVGQGSVAGGGLPAGGGGASFGTGGTSGPGGPGKAVITTFL